jgi:hypothetical protein
MVNTWPQTLISTLVLMQLDLILRTVNPLLARVSLSLPSTGEVAIITCPGDVVVESWSFGGSFVKFKNKDSRPAFETDGAAWKF